MDFSLMQPNSRHLLLRDILALKTRWVYYAILTVDPILRFAWIFYAIFTHDVQHSTANSFFVALAEVTRRGMWTLLRVENEHCANVAQYKASRDAPLPYQLDGAFSAHEEFPGLAEHVTTPGAERVSATVESGGSTGQPQRPDVEPGPLQVSEASTPSKERPDTLGKRSLSTIMAGAHTQDFEKRRKPGGSPVGGPIGELDEDADSSDDESEDGTNENGHDR